MADVVVVGVGNDLRGDDAAGRWVADRLAAAGHGDDVLVVSQHQLTPELVTELAPCRYVVFVDAAVGIAEVTVAGLAPASEAGAISHHASPADLLALCRTLYGVAPQADVVLVPAERFDVGEELSPTARAGVEAAVELVSSLLADRTTPGRAARGGPRGASGGVPPRPA